MSEKSELKGELKKEAIRYVLKDFFGIYKKYPVITATSFLLPAIGSICIFFIPPLIIAKIVNGFSSTGSLDLPAVIPKVIMLGSVWLLGEAFWRIGMAAQSILYRNGINILSKKSFEMLSSREYDFFANNFSGSLTKKAMSYSRNYDRFTSIINFDFFNSFFPMVFAIVVLAGYSLWVPAVLLFFILIAILIVIPLVKKRMVYVEKRHDAGSKMSGRLSDAISNMITVKSFAKEKLEHDEYGKSVDEFTDAMYKADDFQNKRIDAILSPLYVATNIVGLLAGIYFAKILSLEPGAVVVIYSYFSQVTRSFWSINSVYRGVESTVTEAAEFTNLFIDSPVISDASGAKSIQMKDASIEFKNVSFKYPDSDKKRKSFLKDFNLHIPANQKVGLVGPSGGGKTTITKILMRFMDVSSGSVTVGGENISKVTQSSLREAIAYVPQEPLLFHRTLYENISYGNEMATKEEVEQAAKTAHAHDFIIKMKHGYDTVVGERGIKLSGGQRQRVAIARALLRKSHILVLDEATSALDSESEKYIQQGLKELMKDKTALVIAHRLSTIKNLDRILVLENGVITEDGTHAELIKRSGTYARLWGHQTGGSAK